MNFIGLIPMFYYLFFINDFFQNYYPTFKIYTTNIVICFSYKLIEIYSKNQIYLNKLRTRLKKIYINFVKSNPQIVNFIENKFPKKQTKNVDFVSNGKVIASVNSNELFNNDKLQPLLLDIDFLIYTEVSTDNQDVPTTYKKIISYDQYKYCGKTIFHCEPTNYAFLLMEIIIGNDKIMIKLKDDHYNYFVEGNKFDSKFVKYYLNKYNLEKIEDYTIQFLDQNVHEVQIKCDKTILFEKDMYTILPKSELCSTNYDNHIDNN